MINLHVATEFLLWVKAQDVEGILGVEELLIVIDGVNLGLSLGDIDIVVDVLQGNIIQASFHMTVYLHWKRSTWHGGHPRRCCLLQGSQYEYVFLFLGS